MAGRLDPAARHRAVGELTTESNLDVLVVGGGLVGAGTALDAVSRGLRVGLIERADWGAEASGHSGMVVGGSWGDVASPDPVRLRSALRERGRLMEWLAPHVVRRAPFLYPLDQGPRQRVTVGAEVLSYDGMARSLALGRLLPAHRHLSRRVVRRLVPALRSEELTGGVQFYDAQADDARLAITVVRTASAYGAHVASGLQATGLIDDDGRILGVTARDQETGDELRISARVVVLATGLRSPHWLEPSDVGEATDTGSAHDQAESTGGDGAGLTRRVYLVVPRSAIRSSTGLVLPTPSGLIRVVPWGRHWLVGPHRTHLAVGPGDDTDHWPPAAAEDIEELLAALNQHLGVEVSKAQVEGCYVGLTPVVGLRPRLAAAQPLRPGLVLAAESRLTTYRLAAARTVDAAAVELGGLVAPSVTLRLPLLGADGYHARWNQRHLLARRAGLHVARVEHLLNRYGSAADDLLQLVIARPDLRRPVPGAEDYLQVEVLYAVSHEDARGLTDILARRTRVAIGTADGGLTAAEPTARLVAAELGWSEAEVARQVETFQAWTARQRRGLAAVATTAPEVETP